MSQDVVPFECLVEQDGDRAILRPIGEIDLSTSPQLKKVATGTIENGAIRLGVDLRGVMFLDSTGLGALVVILKRVRDKGGNMCLFAAHQQVEGLLSMTGLDTVFHLEPDEAAACKFLTGS